MTGYTLGIDPGLEGGAVLLHPGGSVAVAAWRWRRPKGRNPQGFYVQTIEGGLPLGGTPHRDGTRRVGTLHEVGELLRNRLSGLVVLVLEGLFVPRRRGGQTMQAYHGRIRHVLTLAEAAAEVAGPVKARAVEVYRPTAAEWRPSVLGVARTASSDLSERVACQAMQASRPLVAGLGPLASDPHTAEAACMARWGWVQQQQADQARRTEDGR